VDLLSSAFMLDERSWRQGAESGLTPAEMLMQRASSGLGVDASDLAFYELRPVPSDELKPDGAFAVRVERSGAGPRVGSEGSKE